MEDIDAMEPELDDLIVVLRRAETSLKQFEQEHIPSLLHDALQDWQRGLADSRWLRLPLELRAHFAVLAAMTFGLDHEFNSTSGNVDHAVALYTEALNLSAAESERYFQCLGGLSVVMLERFRLVGQVQDLETGIMYAERLIQEAPKGSPGVAAVQVTLAQGLAERFWMSMNREDLDRAIVLLEGAVEAVDHLETRIAALVELSLILKIRYGFDEQTQDLERQMRIAERAVEESSVDHPMRFYSLSVLAIALRTRYAALGQRADLQRAIDLNRELLAVLPGNARLRSGITVSLALDLLDAWRRDFSSDSENAARKALQEAIKGPKSTPETVLKCSKLWMEWAFERGQWEEVMVAEGYLWDASGRLVKTQVSREGKESWLKFVQDDASLALYSAACMDNCAAALRSAEAGQARLLAEALGANRTSGAVEAVHDVRRVLADVDAITYLAATPAGGVGLIFTAAEGVKTEDIVFLEKVTPKWIERLKVDWSTRYRERGDDRWLECTDSLTGLLWDRIMGGVISRLTSLGVERVVLVPMGKLAALPLHGAWMDLGGIRGYAIDLIEISYAPSLQSLAHALRIADYIGNGETILAVEDPELGKRQRLKYAAAEVELALAVGNFERKYVVRGKEATRASVLDVLSKADVAHFACHGFMDPALPLQSGLYLANGDVLTVRDILAQKLSGSRLAVLSACETGMIGELLPSEVVGLPSSFLKAGFAGIVASLWRVSDFSTALLMVRFYEGWRHLGIRPVAALREAQIWMRDTTNEEKITFLEQLGSRPDGGAVQLVDQLRQGDPAAQEFAHPVFWAGFYYTGV